MHSPWKTKLSNVFFGFASAIKEQLYYWSRDAKNSKAEIDFLSIQHNDIIPVEVKDRPSGKLRSLHLYRKSYKPGYSVVFHSGKMGHIKDENLYFVPLYYADSFAKYGFRLDL